jgi:hypothetical protein
MKRIFIPSFFFLFIFACHSKNSDTNPGGQKLTDTAKKNYLPVADYIKSEIALVDSFPYRLMRYHIMDGRTDSGIITTAVFDRIAKQFLPDGLDSADFEKNFEENSFVDRSTNLISFTYSTKDTGDGLKRVDVLLSPGASVSKLNSIYMESINTKNDSSVISKMAWKAGKNFRIIRILHLKSGRETSDQIIVDWDNSE